MGKPIKVTDVHIEEVLKEFMEELQKLKLSNGKISFTKTLEDSDKKTEIFFTSDAWTKMVALIQEFSDEVAWHGLARRNDDCTGFIIYDILVYPQEVTGATVNTDQEKYQDWLMAHDDDVFNSIRMQGHSHVNMGVTPSGVDTTHRESILQQLEDSMFYIFMVFNKRYESHTVVYDLEQNVMYENSDVTIRLLDTGIGLDAFIADAKEKVSKKTYVQTAIGSTAGSQYNNYYNRSSPNRTTYYGHTNYGHSDTPVAAASGKKSEKKEEKREKVKTGVSGELRDGLPYSAWEDYDEAEWYKRSGY